jgi:hypothetical protein
MSGSISDFKANFSTDLARPSRFDVEVPIPLGMVPYLGASRRLKFRCDNAQLPGRNISTTTQKIYNLDEQFPYQTTFDDITLTFLVSDDMSEKKFFDAWLDWINPSLNFNMKYKKDYAVALRINQYDLQNDISYSVDLYDAFPKSVVAMDLDWSSDGFHKVSVTFAYTRWKNNSLEAIAMDAIENAISYGIDVLTMSRLPTDLAPVEDLSKKLLS